MSGGDSNPLCFECGLCCNGVIFANGQLQAGDDIPALRSLGLRLVPGRRSATGPKFCQPCAGFDGCRCRIYSDRPRYCRKFECLLLRSVAAGETDPSDARRIVRLARGRVDTVKALLRELGDLDEQLALSIRFRRMKRRVEGTILDDATADRFGKLTLAVHDLNCLLSQAFLP